MLGAMPKPRFKDALKSGPLVFDGAMGTMLYERGVYLNKSFEELNLSRPELVADVHRDYLDVGVDVITTNTYGANRVALAGYDIDDKTPEILKAGAKIALEIAGGRAFVAGSIGPSGLLPKDLIRNKTRRRAFEALREAAETLAQAGVDLLVFETFGYLGELEIAVEAAYAVDIPIVAQASFGEEGKTADGAGPREVVDRLMSLGVDMVGANCILGPEGIVDVVAEMVGEGLPVVMQPNAGYPRSVDGRAIYQSSPETFGVVARRAYKRGISAVGGCCGTTPDFMRRVVAACRMMGGGRWRDTDLDVDKEDSGRHRVFAEPRAPKVAIDQRSAFGKKIAHGEFAVSVEVSPPLGLDPKKTIEKIKRLKEAGVDVVNIPDGPRATVRMSNLAMARLVLDEIDMEPLLHVCARDRNLLGLQSDLLGAHALGIRNLVVITGDPPKVGDYPDATAVFDLDSVGMLAHGRRASTPRFDPAGKSHRMAPPSFVLATGAEPAALDFDRELEPPER
jgi:methionine synthase I (cobalamin-dependent)